MTDGEVDWRQQLDALGGDDLVAAGAAFARLHRLKRYCLRTFENLPNRDDLAYEMATKIASGEKGIAADVRSFVGFVCQMVKRSAIDQLRRLGTRRESESALRAEVTLAEEVREHDEERRRLVDAVLRALEGLPTEQRRIVELKLKGKGFEEIAAHESVATSTAHSRFRKAVQRLKLALAEEV